MRRIAGVWVVVIPFLYIMSVQAQIVDMSLTVQSTPSITTSTGEIIFPEQSGSHQFEAGSGGTFIFTNLDGSSVTIIFFIGTTQVTLDFFIDSYDQAAIAADRPLPTDKQVVGSLIYDMRSFEGATETLTFDNPFSMTVHYPQAQLGNLNEETLGIYFWDESQALWIAFPVSSRNIEQNTITILSNHLTLFATLGEQKDTTPSSPLAGLPGQGGGTTGGGGGGGIALAPLEDEKIAVQPFDDITTQDELIGEEFFKEFIPEVSTEESESALFDIIIEPIIRDLQARNIMPAVIMFVAVFTGTTLFISFSVWKRRRK